MKLVLSKLWLRRLVAHLTAPLVVGIAWSLSIAQPDQDFLAEMWGSILLCYFAWLMSGLPSVLFRARRRRPGLWRHVGTGAVLAAVPFILIPTALTSNSGLSLMAWAVSLGMAAGLWYWLCAYWRAPPDAFEPSEQPAQSLS